MNWLSNEEHYCLSKICEEMNIWLSGTLKKYLIRCQILRSKTPNLEFQHKLYFNIGKDLFKRLDVLARNFTVQVMSAREKIFDIGGIRKKTRYVSEVPAQNLAI